VIVIPYFDGLISGETGGDFNIFDIKEGDIAALGVCDIEITGISPYTIGEVRQLLAPNITIVKSTAYNFTPDNYMKGKHLRITGI
jgi:hypothetical protein